MRDALGSVQSVALLGGTSEIGLAIVRRFGSDGRLKRIVLAARDTQKAQVAADELSALPGNPAVEVVAFDAADTATHAPALEQIFSGHVDVVISAFGVLGRIDMLNDVDAVHEVLEVNLVAAVTTGTTVVQKLQAQGSGSFVVLSSVAAERPRANNFVYAASKAGLDSWASGLADALAGSPVTVTVVRPGFVRTQMTEGMADAPLATTPDVIADAVVAGVRAGKPLVWAPAAVRPMMSVLRHLPRPVYRQVAKRAGN